MTSTIYTEIVLKMDSEFHAAGRKIVLFVDNCRAHKLPPDTVLKPIKIELLPPNFTCLLQPLDAGIIQNLKHAYRKRIMRQTVNHLSEKQELKKITVLDAIETVAAAWQHDVKPETIANCFRHAGFGQFGMPAGEAFIEPSSDQMSDHSDGMEDAEALVQEFATTLRSMNNEFVAYEFNASEYMEIDSNIASSGEVDEVASSDESEGTASSEAEASNDEPATLMDEDFERNKEALLRVQNLLQRSTTLGAEYKGQLDFNTTMQHLFAEYALFSILLNKSSSEFMIFFPFQIHPS